ncbi:MAG: YMGG-like glycine zipper-containing protein [Caulobacteraceae bacterium]
MSRSRLSARSVLAASTAALALGLVVLPGLASAQPYGDYPPPPRPTDNGCHRDRAGGTIFGALIGAGIGALLGSNIAANGHRGDGAAVGAGVGAVGGGLVGSSAAGCSAPRYYENGYGSDYDDGRPPPGPARYDGGYAPGYDDRGPPPPPPYDDQGPGYGGPGPYG